MREWWPMVLNHNRNRFRPFSAKSNHSNSIRSRKNQFWAILGKSGQARASPWANQSLSTPSLYSFHGVISQYKKSLETVKPFWRYSNLKNRPLFTPYTPLTSCKKSEKTSNSLHVDAGIKRVKINISKSPSTHTY